jgi:ABC-2 type transport system ATP-binding protein
MPTITCQPARAHKTPVDFPRSTSWGRAAKMRPMLALSGLRKAYGDRVALHGLDLQVQPGEVLALLGPNGAGKSTAVRCVVGLTPPDAGRVTVDGVDALADPDAARRRIGYVPEVARLYESLTPNEYLLLKGRLFDLPDDRIAAAAARLLQGFGIHERADEPMASFSKGMLQKVSLSSALLTSPKLLVLDEPLSGLDVETAFTVKEVIREFAQCGGAALYCSHILDVVQNVAHRIAVLHHGRLLACGTLDELRAQAGSSAGADLGSVFRLLTESHDPAATARALLG